MAFYKKKVGLALSSGGPKGVSHIGVIKQLEKYNVPIDYISGTSMGALVGGWYAATQDIESVERVALSYNWPQVIGLFADFSLPHALVNGSKIEQFIESYIGKMNFNELKVPFVCVATDLKNGEPVIFKSGKVSNAIRASISIPGVFKPYTHDGKILMDGALCYPTPIQPLKDMGSDIIIASTIFDEFFGVTKMPGFFDSLNYAIDIMNYHLSKEETKKAQVIISPRCEDIGWGNLLTNKGTTAVIKLGEDAVTKELVELQSALSRLSFFSEVRFQINRKLPFLNRFAVKA